MEAVQTAIKVKTALSSVGSNPFGEAPKSVKGEDTDSLITGLSGYILVVVALGGIISAALSMFVTISILVDVASISLIALAPYTIYQKRQLRKLGGLRGQQNELRHAINKLSKENSKLAVSVDRLAKNVDGLQGVEEDLKTVVKASGGQAEHLVAIIEENREIRKKMNRNLEAQVVQNVMRQLMRSDRNEDFKFDSKELKRLKTNLSNIPGVKFYKENFEKICSKQRQLSLKDIMAMFRNLKADIPEEESIFHLEPQKSVKTGMIF